MWQWFNDWPLAHADWTQQLCVWPPQHSFLLCLAPAWTLPLERTWENTYRMTNWSFSQRQQVEVLNEMFSRFLKTIRDKRTLTYLIQPVLSTGQMCSILWLILASWCLQQKQESGSRDISHVFQGKLLNAEKLSSAVPSYLARTAWTSAYAWSSRRASKRFSCIFNIPNNGNSFINCEEIQNLTLRSDRRTAILSNNDNIFPQLVSLTLE